MMYDDGKSDTSIVPEKPPNKAASAVAEAGEGREVAKVNPPRGHVHRTQCRFRTFMAAERVRPLGLMHLCPTCRHQPRQEPDEVVPHVRIRAGGAGQPASLPRPSKERKSQRGENRQSSR
jgi:hypothetical protein